MEDEGLPYDMRRESGWTGVFTRKQADGAYPNGTRVMKVFVEPGDSHGLGARATVLGSIKAPEPITINGFTQQYGYFVEWDSNPRVAVFVTEVKIRKEGWT